MGFEIRYNASYMKGGLKMSNFFGILLPLHHELARLSYTFIPRNNPQR